MDLTWFTPSRLEEFWNSKYTSDGIIKSDAAPLASGSFAYLYSSEEIGGAGAAGTVLRVVTAMADPAGEDCMQKEVQAVRAFLTLMGNGPRNDEVNDPRNDEVVMLDMDKQPPGLCHVYCYLIVRSADIHKIFTVMAKGKPLMDVVADRLELANSQPETKFDMSEMVRWMSQIALGMKFMHTKRVFWRDCKLDNIVLVGGEAKIIDINSGVCTVGYASHEQLIKLPINACGEIQMVTNAMEQVLRDQPDHSTWETQDVFALSIVVVELLTYGQFTYPYAKDEPPSYAHLLLYELEVYDLLLNELSSVYDVSVLKGRLDRKIKYWKDKVEGPIDPTTQEVRDLTLWPLAVNEFCRDRKLFDLWASLAFWDHVDHQFNFIGHWTEWYFDFNKHATAASVEPVPRVASVVNQEVEPASQESTQPNAASENAGAGVEAPKVPMAVWRQRADDLSSDVSAIKARIQERSERFDHFEDDHTARVVKRLSSLTHRMDVLNTSLSTFWGANGSPAKGAGLPSVRIVYSTADKVSEVVGERRDKGLSNGAGAPGPRLIEVRLRLRAQTGAKRAELLEALGRSQDISTPNGTPSRSLSE